MRVSKFSFRSVYDIAYQILSNQDRVLEKNYCRSSKIRGFQQLCKQFALEFLEIVYPFLLTDICWALAMRVPVGKDEKVGVIVSLLVPSKILNLGDKIYVSPF